MLKRNGALESVFESSNEFVDPDVLSSYDGGSAMLGVRNSDCGHSIASVDMCLVLSTAPSSYSSLAVAEQSALLNGSR
jgi:hypothetical protein